jgi:two-component system, OmpR family, sensor histidine kinase QseC
MFRSFRNRAIAASILVCVVAWSGYAVWLYSEATNERSARFDKELETSARVVLTGFPPSIAANPRPEAFLLPDGLDLPLHQQFNYQVWRLSDRTLIGRSETAPRTPLNPRFEDGFHTAVLDAERWRSFSLSDKGREIQVQLGETVAQRSAVVFERTKEDLLGLLGLMLLLTTGLGAVAAWSTRPLKILQTLVAARAPTDLQPLPTDALPSEVVPLVAAFNDLLARVQEMQAAQREFVSHAAHELRTPLAAIRAQAQVAERSSDMEEVHASIVRLISGIDRATRVSEQLLLLARVRDLPALDVLTDVANGTLKEMIDRLMVDLAPLCLRRSITIDTQCSPDVSPPVHATYFNIALRNILDNACRYASPGTTVRLIVVASESETKLEVQNAYRKLTPDDLRTLVEPFVRLDDGGEPGSGLGLSIVQRICDVIRVKFTIRALDKFGGMSVELKWNGSTTLHREA